MQQLPSRFWRGQAALLLRPANAALKLPARPALEVTVRQHTPIEDAVVIEGEARPYMVTIDDGPCAGLPLWAAERELTGRP